MSLMMDPEWYESHDYVMDHPEMWLNIHWDVPFATNVEIKNLLRNKFGLWELTYNDIAIMERLIQSKADMIREFYKKLYANIQLETQYNPLENYDMIEEGTYTDNSVSDTTSTNTGKSNSNNQTYQHPMDSGNKRPVGDVDTSSSDTTTSKGTGKNNTVRTHKLTRHGNIGVMAGQDMQMKSRELIVNLTARYCDEFKELFMLRI